MIRIFIVYTLLNLSAASFGQTNASHLFEELYASIQKEDPQKFVDLHVTLKQLEQLAKGYVLEDLNMDSVILAANMVDTSFRNRIINSTFRSLLRKKDSLGLDLSKTKYIDCRYQIIKNPENYFISLKGDVLFKYSDNYYSLPIREALLIGGNWKIIEIDSIALLKDTSFTTVTNISAFQTIESKIEITDIKLEEIRTEPSPPPPPPPPAKRKRKSKT